MCFIRGQLCHVKMSHGTLIYSAQVFERWSPAKHLSLSQVTLKAVLLCLLVPGQGGRTTWMLGLTMRSDVDLVTWWKHLLRAIIIRSLFFEVFPSDKSLCVVHHLRWYVKRTEMLRESEQKLFISWKDPHKGVSRDTIRRWTKMGLETACIDMHIFTPHSARAASTSQAIQSFVFKLSYGQLAGEEWKPLPPSTTNRYRPAVVLGGSSLAELNSKLC